MLHTTMVHTQYVQNSFEFVCFSFCLHNSFFHKVCHMCAHIHKDVYIYAPNYIPMDQNVWHFDRLKYYDSIQKK